MTRVAAVLALLLVLTTSLALAQSWEFRMGFKALADQIPQVAGQPIENEHWGDNGDSLQRTTNGLMAWRKADNWTAFTNGARTWVNGPEGVVERGNEERFEWEAAGPPSVVPPAPRATGQGVIAYVGLDKKSVWVVRPDGSDHRRIVDAGGYVQNLRWSPDGRTLAYKVDPRTQWISGTPFLYLLDVTTGNLRSLNLDQPIWSFAFLPDGQRLAAAREGQHLRPITPDEILAVDLATGKTSHLMNSYLSSEIEAVSLDGQELFILPSGTAQFPTLHRLTFASGGIAVAETPHPNPDDFGLGAWSNLGAPRGINFSPRGDKRVYEFGSGSLNRWRQLMIAEADGSRPWGLYQESDKAYDDPSFSPDGSELVCLEGPADSSGWQTPGPIPEERIVVITVQPYPSLRVLAQGFSAEWQPVEVPVFR